ncbi:MAG: sigma-70 family RNA polymerase sigma factor [Desulfobacteraceae bacterium]|nr:MAG: sigma-70 family RNA polymerase sigma factor [Desulfobacteraceae bacterium]
MPLGLLTGRNKAVEKGWCLNRGTGALPLQEEELDKPLGDLELVERAKRRETAAAEELVRRYQEKAYAIAYRTCSGDAEEAKDLTQEAFLKAFRNLHQFKGQASFYTWLYRIVVNTCLDGARKQKRRKWFSSSWGSEQEEKKIRSEIEESPDHNIGGNPAATLNRKELKAHVKKALSGLSTSQRMIFEMKIFDDMSIPEIARVANIAEGTVKSHLFRATRHIRKALSEWEEK